MENYNKKKKDIVQEKKDSHFNSIPSNYIDNIIKNLYKPRFLGSIHLDKPIDNNISQIENLIKTNHQIKLNKSIKNSLFNPFTKILIFIIIIFNILWFSFKFYS